MGNHNNAVFEIFGVFQGVYKSRNNIALTSDFCNIDKMTFIVNTDERFNLQKPNVAETEEITASLELIKGLQQQTGRMYFYTVSSNVFF